MRLFSINWTFEDIDRECEWTHVVMAEYPTAEQQLKIIADFMLENHEETPEDYDVHDYWAGTVDVVDGYKIIVGDKI